MPNVVANKITVSFL